MRSSAKHLPIEAAQAASPAGAAQQAPGRIAGSNAIRGPVRAAVQWLLLCLAATHFGLHARPEEGFGMQKGRNGT